jgi:hypothetical protein
VRVADSALGHRSSPSDVPTLVVAILLLLQAALFGWYAVDALSPTGLSRSFSSLEQSQLTVISVAEALGATGAFGLAIFVQRGSRIALIVATVVCTMEVLLGAWLGATALLMGSFLVYLLLYVIIRLPLLGPAVLAVPTLIMCVRLLRSRQAVHPLSAAASPKLE